MSQQNSVESITVSLDSGTHWICTCGLSENFPYCNGSHKATSLQPQKLDLQTPQVVEIAKVQQS
jgi:CDGSH-type Zn-finger protein